MSKKNVGIVKSYILIFLIALTITTCIFDRPKSQNSDPQIAVDEEGNSYLTWRAWHISCKKDDDIFWVKISNEGVVGSIQKISNHPENIKFDDRKPQIAIDGQKNTYIAWHGKDGNDSETYWVKIDAEGVQGEVEKISVHPDNIENSEYDVQITADAQGNSYMVWEGKDRHNDSDTYDFDIYWVKVSAEGVLGEVMKISTHPDNINFHDYEPTIAVDAQGASMVVWYGCDGDCINKEGDYEIYWVKIDAEDVPREVQKISALLEKTKNFHFFPQIVVDGRGNSSVVWDGKVSDSSNTWLSGIFWVRIDAEGVPGTIQRISAYQDGVPSTEGTPRIAVDGKGNSYVTWHSCVGDDCGYLTGDHGISWLKISADGILGDVQKMPVHPDNRDKRVENPVIAVDAQGNSFVVWSGHRRGDIDLYGVKIDAEGIPGEAMKLSTYSGSSRYNDENPQIAVDGEGNFYVTWDTYRMPVDEGIPCDVYWVKIDTSGIPGRVQKISVSDFPCGSLDNNTNKIVSMPWMYFFDVLVIGFALYALKYIK